MSGYNSVVLASIVIILAAIKIAAVIVVPFLLALFIAIILSPAYGYLKKKGLPSALALVSVLGVFLVVIVFVAKLITASAFDFSQNLPSYTQRLGGIYNDLVVLANKYHIELSTQTLSEIANTKQLMKFVSSMVQGVGGMFTNGFVVILMVAFMLIESQSFSQKIHYILSKNVQHVDAILEKIKRYMVIKALISLVTAGIVYVALLLIGTDYPFLWAVLAFFLNFIPNIGSIIAAVPAVLITLVELGFGSAILTAAVYVMVNIGLGSIIEPKIMGKGLGVSTLVVFLSLIFWGWLLGIVGMFLSIPLTIMAKIAAESNERTKWIAVMIGNEVEKKI